MSGKDHATSMVCAVHSYLQKSSVGITKSIKKRNRPYGRSLPLALILFPDIWAQVCWDHATALKKEH